MSFARFSVGAADFSGLDVEGITATFTRMSEASVACGDVPHTLIRQLYAEKLRPELNTHQVFVACYKELVACRLGISFAHSEDAAALQPSGPIEGDVAAAVLVLHRAWQQFFPKKLPPMLTWLATLGTAENEKELAERRTEKEENGEGQGG